MHFSLLLVSNTGADEEIKELLAPYCEYNEIEFEEIEKDDLKYMKKLYKESKKEDCFEDFMFEDGYIKKNDKFGIVINPSRKWDWYVIGGRWNNLLLKKDGSEWDSLRVSDFCFDTSLKNIKKIRAENYEESKKESVEHKAIMYDIKPGMSKDEYVEKASFYTFAILDENGWRDHGWFKKDKDSDWEKNFVEYITNLPTNKQITIIDCHI